MWLPRKGIGSNVTFEMGEPFLVTREPMTRPDVHPRLRRRHVDVQGDLHLWVQADLWELRAESWTLQSSAGALEISRRLLVLAGQRITAFDFGDEAETTIRFEYGETFAIQSGPDPEETQWTLYRRGAGHISWLSRGELRAND